MVKMKPNGYLGKNKKLKQRLKSKDTNTSQINETGLIDTMWET